VVVLAAWAWVVASAMICGSLPATASAVMVRMAAKTMKRSTKMRLLQPARRPKRPKKTELGAVAGGVGTVARGVGSSGGGGGGGGGGIGLVQGHRAELRVREGWVGRSSGGC
jgi:hypothetical protein